MVVTGRGSLPTKSGGTDIEMAIFYTDKFIQGRNLIAEFNLFLFAENPRCMSNSISTILYSTL